MSREEIEYGIYRLRKIFNENRTGRIVVRKMRDFDNYSQRSAPKGKAVIRKTIVGGLKKLVSGGRKKK